MPSLASACRRAAAGLVGFAAATAVAATPAAADPIPAPAGHHMAAPSGSTELIVSLGSSGSSALPSLSAMPPSFWIESVPFLVCYLSGISSSDVSACFDNGRVS